MTPIPMPETVVAFILRHFSNDLATRKWLARISAHEPVPMAELMTKLAPDGPLRELLIAFGDSDAITRRLKSDLSDYIGLCRDISCGDLTVEEVRALFDRLAVGEFSHWLDICQKGLSKCVLGDPDHALTNVWNGFLKGRSFSEAAEPFDEKFEHEAGSWEKQIRRWSGGTQMSFASILKIVRNIDFNFGLSLMIAKSYQEYCRSPNVCVSRHAPPWLDDFSMLRRNLECQVLMRKRWHQKYEGRIRAQIQEQSYLAAPERQKAPGECIRSKFLLANISEAMRGQSRSAALGINWGYHYVQMGDLDAAMREFEKAARYFAYRDFSQMKLALRLLLLICQAQKRRTPLEKWSHSLGLDVDVSAGPEGLLSAFPHPFPEAQIYPLPRVPKDPKAVQIDFANPNKTINGFSSSRISQVWFCTRYNRVKDLSRLIDAGATPWAKVDKPCALFLSMALGHRECVELLLPLTPLSAIDTALTQTVETCLSIAIRKREPSWVKAMLERGAAVDAPGPEGQSPLFQALHHWLPRLQTQKALQTQNMALELQGRLPRVVQQQISPFPEERGDFVFNALFSDPGLKSEVGEMMHSDLSPDVSAKSIVECLLENAADAEAGDVDGVTPLMLAAQYGARWPMEELLYNGASPRCRDRQMRTVVSMLHQHGHEEMVGWFLSLLSQEDRQWFV